MFFKTAEPAEPVGEVFGRRLPLDEVEVMDGYAHIDENHI